MNCLTAKWASLTHHEPISEGGPGPEAAHHWGAPWEFVTSPSASDSIGVQDLTLMLLIHHLVLQLRRLNSGSPKTRSALCPPTHKHLDPARSSRNTSWKVAFLVASWFLVLDGPQRYSDCLAGPAVDVTDYVM